MAIKWPLANGNWSNAANWNDGTLPDVGDDVHADGKTVTIDQDITVLSIRNDQRSGGTANGGFNFATTLTTYNITADLFGFNANLITINQASRTYNFIGNLYGLVGSTVNISVITTSSASNIINITGDINVESGTGVQRTGVRLNNLDTVLNIIGNVSIGGSFSAGGSAEAGAIQLSSTNTVNITGNLTVNGAGTGSRNDLKLITIRIMTGSNIINIYGNVLANQNFQSGSVLGMVSAVNLNQINIYGIVSGKFGFDLINSTIVILGTNTIRIDKIIGSDNGTGTAIVNTTNSNLIVKEFEFSSIGTVPAIGKCLIDNTTFTLIARNESLQTVIFTEDNNVLNFIPTEPNVRKNTTYYDGLKVGTLEVPSPSNVRKGVPTDNTVGTAELTGEDILQAIQDSTTPLAERLRNVSTVQTSGAQLQAYLDQ